MQNKLFVLEDSSKSKFGGGQKITLEVLEILSENFNVELFDTNNNSIFYQKAQPLCSNKNILLSFSKMHNGVKGIFFRIIELFSFGYYIYKNIKIIKTRLDKNKNILIYATTRKSIIYAYIIKLLYKNEFIYHAHLAEKGILNRLAYRHFMSKAKKVIAVSNFIRNNISLNNTCVIYNPIIPKESQETKILGNIITIAVFASLIKIKGVKYFIESYNYIKPEFHKRIIYHIYGTGYEEKSLKKHGNENIIFKGFCNNVIEEMNNKINILCFPTIIEEACPMTILEAFSCGIPVISTNIGGQAELVKEEINGSLIPIKNPIEIANKINLLVEFPELYTNLAQGALKSANNYSYEIFMQNITNVFIEF